MIVYGDMGRTGGEPSLPALIQEVASGSYDAILHVGDFAYDLDSDGGVVSIMNNCYILCSHACMQYYSGKACMNQQHLIKGMALFKNKIILQK